MFHVKHYIKAIMHVAILCGGELGESQTELYCGQFESNLGTPQPLKQREKPPVGGLFFACALSAHKVYIVSIFYGFVLVKCVAGSPWGYA